MPSTALTTLLNGIRLGLSRKSMNPPLSVKKDQRMDEDDHGLAGLRSKHT